MSEISSAALNTGQERISPRIEDEILEFLKGDLKETALGFVNYLMSNQMTPQQWFGPTYWRIPFGYYYLCSIFMSKDKWRIFFFSGEYKGELEEGLIKAVQEHVTPCVSCTGDDCPKRKEMTVFGKVFPNTCYQFPIQFTNPDGYTLEFVKELIEYWKDIAPHSDSWHCH